MQFVAIRHARTEYNEKELINGTIDEDLSVEGLKQIDDLLSNLTKYHFSVVYTSPLKRSVQTAQPIATQHKISLKEDPRLIEVNMGSFNGQPWDSTIPDFGVNSSGLLSTCEYDLTPYGGETSDQVRARVQDFINDLKKHPDDIPLVVTHGGILRMLYYLCTGEKAGRIPNSSIHTFTV